MSATASKQTGEHVRFGIDFTNRLASGDTVTSTHSVKVYDGTTDKTSTMLATGTENLTGNILSGMFQGGTEGKTYKIVFLMTTHNGETLEEDVYLLVSGAMDRLKERLRRQLGSPIVAQLSDEQANDAVQSAIYEYSKNRPNKIFDYFLSVGDQATYDLSAKERIMNVKKVYYWTGYELDVGLESFWPSATTFIDYGRLTGISLFENPSVWLQYLQKLEQYNYMFEGEWEYNKLSKQLRLIPPPTSTDEKIYFIYTQRLTPEMIPEEEIDGVLIWAKAEAMEAIGGLKNLTQDYKSVSGFGQSVTVGNANQILFDQAEKLRKQFERRYGGGSSMVIG